MTQPNPQFTDPRETFKQELDFEVGALQEEVQLLTKTSIKIRSDGEFYTNIMEAATTYAESYAATYAEGKVREARLDEALKHPQPLYEQGFQDGAREAPEAKKVDGPTDVSNMPDFDQRIDKLAEEAERGE